MSGVFIVGFIVSILFRLYFIIFTPSLISFDARFEMKQKRRLTKMIRRIGRLRITDLVLMKLISLHKQWQDMVYQPRRNLAGLLTITELKS